MSQLADIEDAIVGRLKNRLASQPEGKGVAVELYPDKPENHQLKGRAALLVGYGRSDYGDIGSGDDDAGDIAALGAVATPRHMTFAVSAVCRDLGSRSSAVDLLEAARLILTGWRPIHCVKPLVPVSDGLTAYHQGKWVFEINMRTEALAIGLDEGEDLPLIRRLSAEWEGAVVVDIETQGDG